MPDIILVSGGFDPIHSGHIKLINDANKYGDVIWLPLGLELKYVSASSALTIFACPSILICLFCDFQ